MRSLEREDCGRCGGTGEVTKMVAGRSGLVPCPDCDNIPQYAIPEDPPDDPRARLEEIEARLDELRTEKRAWKNIRDDLGEATDLIGEAAADELMPDEAGVKLDFLRQQIGVVLHELHVGQGIRYEKEQLGEEKAKLQTLIDALEEQHD